MLENSKSHITSERIIVLLYAGHAVYAVYAHEMYATLSSLSVLFIIPLKILLVN